MFENPIMTEEYFQDLTNSFRSPHIWKYDIEKKKWSLRNKIK